MTWTKNIKRKVITVLVFLIAGVVSNILVRKTNISTFAIFDASNLFTYFGVLIGFALTVYTFGLSMVSDIKAKIDCKNELSTELKDKLYSNLISGFSEIKSDIWLIFYSIIIIILFAIAKEVHNPFGWNVETLMIPETVNITLFITTTIGMWDIMQAMFNLAEISLELNKK